MSILSRPGRTLLALICLASTLGVAAQERCPSRTITERWMQTHGLHEDLAAMASGSEQQGLRGGGLQTIPVVVHVVWNTTAENVSNAVVHAIIDRMNADYQALNADYDDARPVFLSSRGDAQIAFCLASIDPDGNPTDGILRTHTTETWFNPDTETDDMKQDPWDPSHYLNIWICDISSGATGGLVTAGYAYLPVGGMVGSPIDGLVLDYSYGTGASSRTATHEVGHYLGLDHPWGNNNCVPGDGISDTPATDSPTFSCNNTGLMKCGTLTQYENFMDYSDCSMMFTSGQTAVMNGVLNGIRSGLLNSPGCGNSSGPCIPVASTGTSNGDYIDGVELAGISNTGTGSSSGPAYQDYSATYSTALAQGSEHSITITGGTSFPDHYAAWIDYNGNQEFDSSEKLGEFTSTAANFSQTLSFTVPIGIPLGATVLRVRGVFVGSGDPNPVDACFNYAKGETEDYGIVIEGGGIGYCLPTSTVGTEAGDYIDNVILGDIVNMGTGPGDPAYTDFTSQTTVLEAGQAYTFEATSGDNGQNRVSAWIDFNGDHVFGASELLGSTLTSMPYQLIGFGFSVPASAVPGPTRLRVRSVSPGTGEPDGADPCFDFNRGETEDYGIVISTGSGISSRDASMGLTVRNFPGRMEISWPTVGQSQQVQVLDASGRAVLTPVPHGTSASIPTAALAPGIYHVLVTVDGKRSMARFFPITE